MYFLFYFHIYLFIDIYLLKNVFPFLSFPLVFIYLLIDLFVSSAAGKIVLICLHCVNINLLLNYIFLLRINGTR